MIPATNLDLMRRMRDPWKAAGLSAEMRTHVRSEYHGNVDHVLWQIAIARVSPEKNGPARMWGVTRALARRIASAVRAALRAGLGAGHADRGRKPEIQRR